MADIKVSIASPVIEEEEINAVIEEAKSTTSGNVYVVFQPHTYCP